MTSCYKNIIPVMSSEGHMTLLDLAAPFLFRGRKRFYGSVELRAGNPRVHCSRGFMEPNVPIITGLKAQPV